MVVPGAWAGGLGGCLATGGGGPDWPVWACRRLEQLGGAWSGLAGRSSSGGAGALLLTAAWAVWLCWWSVVLSLRLEMPMLLLLFVAAVLWPGRRSLGWPGWRGLAWGCGRRAVAALLGNNSWGFVNDEAAAAPDSGWWRDGSLKRAEPAAGVRAGGAWGSSDGGWCCCWLGASCWCGGVAVVWPGGRSAAVLVDCGWPGGSSSWWRWRRRRWNGAGCWRAGCCC